MNKVRKYLIGLLCISLIGGLAFLNSAKVLKKTSKADFSQDAFKIEKCNYNSTRDTIISMKKGKYTIKRTNDLYGAKDENHGYWTFLIYLSGNEDESKNGVCSGILDNIVSASTKAGEKVKFIVATGGASNWKKGDDAPFKLNRKLIQFYEVCNGNVSTVKTDDNKDFVIDAVAKDNDKMYVTSMGNPDVLNTFISMGVNKYRTTTVEVEEAIEDKNFSDVLEEKNSKKKDSDNTDEENTEDETKKEENKNTKIVEKTYNNHIGLFIYGNNDVMDKGVAYDANCKDYLTASELELALNASKGAMGNKFDLICFDGTVSQYVEMANMLVPYAEYLVGPQCKGGYSGVKYDIIAEDIGLGYSKTAYEVASNICETCYLASNDAVKKKVVLSAIDLKNMDAFLYRLNSTLAKLNKMIETKPEEFTKYSLLMNKAAATSENSVDMGNFLRKIGPKINGISYTYSNYNRLIANKVSAIRYSENKNCTGLSVYWNMKATDADYEIIKNNSVNPYLLNIMDASMYISNKSSLEQYNTNRKSWEEAKDYYSRDNKYIDVVANGRIEDKQNSK